MGGCKGARVQERVQREGACMRMVPTLKTVKQCCASRMHGTVSHAQGGGQKRAHAAVHRAIMKLAHVCLGKVLVAEENNKSNTY